MDLLLFLLTDPVVRQLIAMIADYFYNYFKTK